MGKLSHDERLALLHLVAEAVGGRVPLAVTVFDLSEDEAAPDALAQAALQPGAHRAAAKLCLFVVGEGEIRGGQTVDQRDVPRRAIRFGGCSARRCRPHRPRCRLAGW